MSEYPSAKRPRIESDENLPELTDIDAHLLDISKGNESLDLCYDINILRANYHVESSVTSVLNSVLTPPSSPLSVDTNMNILSSMLPKSPMSPLPTMSFPWLINPQEPTPYQVQQYPEEHSLAPVQFQGSQVTVMLPDGSNSSQLDKQVPAAQDLRAHTVTCATRV